jgi:hypothetical protein
MENVLRVGPNAGLLGGYIKSLLSARRHGWMVVKAVAMELVRRFTTQQFGVRRFEVKLL